MRALRLLPVLALAAEPLSAQPRWQEIGKTVVGNPVYLDRRTMSTKGGITTATLRVAFVKPVRTQRGELTSSRTIVRVDCAKRELAVQENWYYHDEKANRVYEHKRIAQPGFGKAFEGSMQGVAVAHLCRTG
ncbi:MAG: surface-adhesin E family protein [Gemmatirosa sp.]